MTQVLDAKKISVVFGGVTLSGFADGDFLSISDQEDLISATKGADGVTQFRVLNNSDSELTITCQHQGQADTVLSSLTAGIAFTKLPLVVIDTSGANPVVLLATAEAAIMRRADVSRSKASEDTVDWTFHCVDATRINGDLATLSSAIQSAVNDALSLLGL
jgi:hypothetical protein